MLMLREAWELRGTEVWCVPGTRQLGDCMAEEDEGVAINAFQAPKVQGSYNIGEEKHVWAEAKEARLQRGQAQRAENEKKNDSSPEASEKKKDDYVWNIDKDEDEAFAQVVENRLEKTDKSS